ncbi:MAG: hypothetical protein V7603_2773 [Micromonosporaceae bacterium]
MNLTVGPLPPAVYWRRRAIVLGALLLVVVFLVAMCSGSGKPGAARNAAAKTSSGTGTPSGDPSVLTPIDGGDGGGDTTATGPASPATGGVPAQNAGPPPSSSGPCADTDISLTAVATPLAKGFYFSMKVKNTSTRACSRDVGGSPQALQVVNAAGAVVWTSDSCAVAGRSPQPDVRVFGPGIESVLPPRPFYWDGTVGKCNKGTAPPAGAYRMVARLDTKISAPIALVGK